MLPELEELLVKKDAKETREFDHFEKWAIHWRPIRRYKKECGRSLCGCGAVQHVGAYSVRLGFRKRQGTEEFERKPIMTCRINRHVIGEDLVILCISGRITGQDADILRNLLRPGRERNSHRSQGRPSRGPRG